MKKRRLFIALAILVFCGILAIASYGIGWCAEPIRLGFADPLSSELSSYGIGKTHLFFERKKYFICGIMV